MKSRYRSKLYYVWCAIVQRCTNPRCKDWPLYGGRGITMCTRWRESFDAFVADMGPRPPGAMVDRVDNDGPYSSDNCRWASAREQMRNRRSNRILEFRGERRSVVEWAERTGISRKTITARLERGWSIERALIESAFVGKNGSTRAA